MFQSMIQMMESQTNKSFDEKGGATAFWFREWFREILKAFEPDAKVIYTSSYAYPMEILRAFDVVPFDFELAAGLIGRTEMGIPTMQVAEDRGYSQDVCSFHRLSLGATHLNLFPKPELLTTTSYYCEGKSKTNELLAKHHGKQADLLYVPVEITKDSVAYVKGQLERVIQLIEKTLGQKFDLDRLKDAVRSSNRARKSHLKILELLKHRPAPWSGRRMIAYSINGNWFNGLPMKEELNDAFVQELQSRIETGNLRTEAHRLYWFAWMTTYPSNVFKLLKKWETSVPLCETMRMYWDEIDEDDPLEGLALKCLQNPFVGSGERRLEGLAEIRDQYALDGAVLFATPACRHSKSGYRWMEERLAKIGLPMITLDLDISDPRGFSPEQTATRVEGFVEMLGQ
jgi:benzoyl-CoA reductase/2-hydroxyglutaryl-CoA dehydratase subunit BcrC/BadD/HgdB